MSEGTTGHAIRQLRNGVELRDPNGDWWTVYVRRGNERLQSPLNSVNYPFFVAYWNLRWRLGTETKRTWRVMVFHSERKTWTEMADAVVNELFASREAALRRAEQLVDRLGAGLAVTPTPRPAPGSKPPVFATPEEADAVMAGVTPAGWRQDPQDPRLLRYWDGAAWTGHQAPPTMSRPQ